MDSNAIKTELAPDGRSAFAQLPRGRHSIPPEVISRNQRTRLITAMAEVAASHGYATTSVAMVVSRAGVSRATFYQQFSDREDCILKAHDEFFAELLEAMDAASRSQIERTARVRAAVHAALGYLAERPAVGQLLTVEIMAAGPAGAARHHQAIEQLAQRMRASRDIGEDGGWATSNMEWGLMASMAMQVARRIVAGEAESLLELQDELSETIIGGWETGRPAAAAALLEPVGV